MQLNFLLNHDDFSDERPIIGLSGGINSAALLCYLATEHPVGKRPATLLLYYAHLAEHSPDTFAFVKACVRYARRHFDARFRMHRTSMVDWIRRNNMIPHPTVSPCTYDLKIEPMEAWAAEMGATCDLIGYVRHERRRIKRQLRRDVEGKRYPIAHLSESDCMHLVKREIGWYPAIYDIKDRRGNRVFTHNNCLYCKNMTDTQRENVQRYYPDYAERSEQVASEVGTYWGRASEYAGDACTVCAFD